MLIHVQMNVHLRRHAVNLHVQSARMHANARALMHARVCELPMGRTGVLQEIGERAISQPDESPHGAET